MRRAVLWTKNAICDVQIRDTHKIVIDSQRRDSYPGSYGNF